MNKSLFTVIGFTVRNKFKAKAFLISSLVIAIIMSVAINIPYIISLFSNDDPRLIGMVDTKSPYAAGLEQYYAKQEKPDIKLIRYPDQGDDNEAMMKEHISAGDIEGYIEFTDDKATGIPKVTYKSEDTLNVGAIGELQTALQIVKTDIVLKDAGLTEAQKKLIYTNVTVDQLQISSEKGAGSVGNDGKTESQIAMAAGTVYVTVFLLFMGIMITGQLIATEITAEKSSRVMEVLITSVHPLAQMFGKIIGMFIVGITQIGILVIVAIINIALPHNIKILEDMNLKFSDMDPTLIVYAIIFYLLGYLLFSTLFAAVGSIVSRTEDLGQALMPLTFLSMAGFYIAIFGLSNPNASFVVVSSFIPFFTPYIMLLRIGTADPTLWQVWISLGVLVVTIILFGWLSAKIYRTGVLMYGKRPSIKEIRKAMKAYK